MVVKITVQKSSGNMRVKSEWNKDLVNFFRSRSVRKWDAVNKEWIFPDYELNSVIDYISPRFEYSITTDESEKEYVSNLDSVPDWYQFKLKPFKHQVEGICYGLQHPKFLLADEQGLGKALALDTKVYTPTGYKLMKDIEVGDYVFNAHGNPVKVLATYYHENVNMCRITFSDNVTVDCCEDHLWKIYDKRGSRVVDTKWFFDDNQYGIPRNFDLHSVHGSIRYFINLCEPVNFNSVDVDTNPYDFGKNLNMGENSIPDFFKYNSKYVRFGIVQGIFDAHGVVCENSVKVTVRSVGLRDDVVFLVQSLGFTAVCSAEKDNTSFSICVSGYDLSKLFHSSENRNKFLIDDAQRYRGIIRVERIGLGNAKCITVDDQEGLYLIDNFVVTHNTKQMLDLSCILKKEKNLKHVLIITCVNSLKYNWRNEVSIHTDELGYILGTRYRKNGREIIGDNSERLIDLTKLDSSDFDKYFFIITNIETLRYKAVHEVEKKTKKGVTKKKRITEYPIVDQLQKLMKDGVIGMVIADEIHRCKDSASQSGRALLSLDCPYKVALTGTPIMNKPVDLYTPLHWLDVERHSFWAFSKRYCITGIGSKDVIGYKNLHEIQSMLDSCMLRRLKSEVLDLPEKIIIRDYVEMTKDQWKLYDDVRNQIIEDIDKVRLSPNPLTQLTRLRQVTGNPSILSSKVSDNPKYKRMCEIIEDVAEAGGKAVVFSFWTNIINPAFDLLKSMGYNPALYTGENTDSRESEKERFMTNPSCKVILGTVGAMGTGLTLTAANTAIFLDDPWNRATKDQCEDRIHRIGTTGSVNIITIMCKDTIDERINDIVYRKGKLSDVIIDREEDIRKNPKVLDYLLSIK